MAKPVILCVDDEQIILSSLKEQLKRNFSQDFLIETAENGEEALEVIEELIEEGASIPVVISDHIMPGIKGDELLIKIHEKYPETLKILLTGQADADAVGNAVNKARLYRYISKPWEQADLELTVTEAAKSYNQKVELCEKNTLLLKVNEELKEQVETFHKFVPSQFIKTLNINEGMDHIKLGVAVKKEMAVLFADIRNFTPMSEKLSPEESFEFINTYLSYMGPVIRKNGGFIDKYIGDAIMALFENSDNAVVAGREMLEKLKELNSKRAENGEDEINIGIGIHTGSLVLGTVGEENRLQTTVIGETVNIAARTEAMTKVYDTPFIVTDRTKTSLSSSDSWQMREIDRVKLRGVSYEVGIYEFLDTSGPDISKNILLKNDIFQQARKEYTDENYEAAAKLFQECYEHCPNDNVSKSYINRCNLIIEKKL